MDLLAFYKEGAIEAGCDEAGRGCLAGPVVAGAVVLPKDFHHDLINDSKKLSKKQREKLEIEIKEQAVSWAIGEVSNEEIDEINILNASFLAMHRAIDQLPIRPEHLIIDGNRFTPYGDIRHQTVIGGDGKYFSIAAASILAKTHRDSHMKVLHEEYPQYDWVSNAGYPTKKHREGIKKFGITPYHRQSFRLLPDQMELF